jgi:glycosyltransferase involved in cell wall biosynthesis
MTRARDASPRIITLLCTPAEGLGGLEYVALALSAALQSAGACVEIVAPPRVLALPTPLLDGAFGHFFRWRMSARLLQTLPQDFDLLICHDGAGWGVKFHPQIRLWHTEAAEYAKIAWPQWHPNHWKLRYFDSFLRRRIGSPSLNYAVSHPLARFIRDHVGLSLEGVIPLGIDTTSLRPLDAQAGNAFRQRYNLPERPALLVGYVGRADTTRNKNIALFAKWARQFQQHIHVILAGPDSLPSCFQGLPNVRALGRIARSELPHLYTAMDAIIRPSYYETAGLVAIEALACGTPLLTTITGYVESIVEAVPDFAAWAVPASNPELLGDRIAKWIHDPMSLHALRQPLRSHVTQFYSMETFQRRWVETVENVLETSRNRKSN